MSAKPRREEPSSNLLLPLLLMMPFAIALVVYLVWAGRVEAVRGAETNVRNLASTIEAHIDGLLRGTHGALDELVARIDVAALRPANAGKHRVIPSVDVEAELRHMPELKALGVLAADGSPVFLSSAYAVWPKDMGTQEFFRELRDNPGIEIAYSGVVAGEGSSDAALIIAHAVRDAEGRFLGVVAAQIALARFSDLFGAIDVGENGVIVIRRRDDFSHLLRQPPLPAGAQPVLPSDHPVRLALSGGAHEAVLMASSPVDGVRRILGIRVIDHSPFFVTVAMAESDVLAAWRARTLAVSLFAAAVMVVLWLMRGLLRRSEDRLAEVSDTARAAQERAYLLAEVFEHAGEAIVVTDAENRIVSVNRAFTNLTGYALDECLGRNPRFLSAERSTPEEYAAMWRALREEGQWQGEIWDKRKDGSCYPKWLTISTLKDANNELTHYIGSFTDISERKLAEQNVHYLAHHDVLTDLPNRFSLHQKLEQAVATANREQRQLAVMFLDLDHFKRINDTLGHPVGDALLVEVATRLRSCVRESDIVARLGGDEFVVVMTELAEGVAYGIPVLVRKIIGQLSEPYRIGGRELHVTPSIGVSVFPMDGDDVDTLMRNADTAMYHAKAQGRRNFQFFTAAMNTAAEERLELENALRASIERGEFVLHYQPQVDMSTGRIIGLESLVRWRHPRMGLLAPDRFIPLAEESGLIEPLGQWILDEVCRQLRDLVRLGYGHLRVAMNVSARQLHDPDFAARISNSLVAHDIRPDRLELEITESLAAELTDSLVVRIADLRAQGVVLSIDDFGTGYSSLSRLKLLPFHQIKLDGSFVRDLETDANNAAICSATIALANGLGLGVVIEGVETEAQLAYLRGLKADIIQGYYFSRPLPAAELLAFMGSHKQKRGS